MCSQLPWTHLNIVEEVFVFDISSVKQRTLVSFECSVNKFSDKCLMVRLGATVTTVARRMQFTILVKTMVKQNVIAHLPQFFCICRTIQAHTNVSQS